MRNPLKAWIEERFPGAALTLLAGDASKRRFFRLTPVSGESLVVMDYGKPFDGRTDDQRLNSIFVNAGLPVPRIDTANPEVGCLLVQDLGGRMLEDELKNQNDQTQSLELLLRAAELAGRIARDGTPALAESDRAGGPTLDSGRFRFEMDFFLENLVVKHRKITGEHTEIIGWLHRLADRAAETPFPVLCHRDYHSRNIMVASDGSLALVDIQDARWGPDTYDLVSLAFDAYIERPDEWVEPLIERYLATAGINDDALVRRRVHLVASQRMIKALGTFGYQVEVAGNPRYADAIPRTLARLDRWLARSRETLAIHRAFGTLGLFDSRP